MTVGWPTWPGTIRILGRSDTKSKEAKEPGSNSKGPLTTIVRKCEEQDLRARVLSPTSTSVYSLIGNFQRCAQRKKNLPPKAGDFLSGAMRRRPMPYLGGVLASEAGVEAI